MRGGKEFVLISTSSVFYWNASNGIEAQVFGEIYYIFFFIIILWSQSTVKAL